MFGPQEGWNSAGASAVGYLPNSSSASPTSKNPKSNGQGASLAVPTPKITPVYEHVTEYQSLKLYRVSDAVPYCTYLSMPQHPGVSTWQSRFL
jgi:hypothetical protein